MKFSIAVAGVCLCLVSLTAGAHGSLNFRGSEGGIVRALVVIPGQPSIIYAATSQAGVFKSDDQGKHWRPLNQGLDRADVLTLVAKPSASRVLYAGTRKGLFKTINGGITWEMADSALAQQQIKTLCFDSTNAKLLYAGTTHGVWRSADDGATWQRLSKQPENLNISALIIAPDIAHSIYAGTSQGLYVSRDHGESWMLLSKGIVAPSITLLVLDPSHPQIIYAGTGDGAYRSDDSGDTWHSITFSQTNLPVTALLVDSVHTDTIYLGTSFVGGFFKTEDAGKSWVRIRGEDFTPSITSLVFLSGDAKTLLAGTSFNTHVFISRDAGLNWKPTPQEPTLPALVNLSGTADGKFLYAATQEDGVYRFQISRHEWQYIGDPQVGVLSKVLYADGKSPTLWACGSKGVARGRFKNGAWTFQRQPLAYQGCTDVIQDNQTKRVIVSGKTEIWAGPGRWQRRHMPTPGEPVYFIAFSKNGERLYALTEHRALESRDTGKTWQRIDEAKPFTLTAIGEMGKKPSRLWLATDSDIFYRDAEGKWVSASEGIFPPGVGVLAESVLDNSVYATSLILGRIFSLNENQTWSANDLEEGVRDLSDMWIDPERTGVLYIVSKRSGLFMSEDYGRHWTALNAGLIKQVNHKK